ncbi:MAG: alpha-amylase, partial [Psychrosphaera sp.]|nr:alpha-amylase [Psychrosphaera sp.]
AWTKFDFTVRNNKYSNFKWTWYHFDGVDWAQNLNESSIFKFRGTGKGWDWQVDTENQNYDYLMFADLDMDHPEVVQELKDWGQWYINFASIDGFRLDAVKHIKYEFFNDWLDHLRSETGKSLFTVGEFWSYDKQKLHDFISATGGRMSLFDAPLHMNFHVASSSGGGYNMATLADNTLMKEQPGLAVTLVDNHDTQPCQALESAVQDWFKPMAYAFILLREQGYPNIFHADYYGANYTTSDNNCSNTEITINSHKVVIDKLLDARKNYAYGQQIDYLDHSDVIGWTRLGDATHPKAMAVIMTDAGTSSKWMNVSRTNTAFVDVSGNRSETITSNNDGWAQFPVNGGSFSVWVEQTQPQSGNVAVTFSCSNGYTVMGQDVYAVGSTSELGSWNSDNAVKLSPSSYPTWTGTVSLPSSTAVQWKCIKKQGSTVQWQSGSNNSYQTPSTGSGNTSGSF